jgi:hypothetical protein
VPGVYEQQPPPASISVSARPVQKLVHLLHAAHSDTNEAALYLFQLKRPDYRINALHRNPFTTQVQLSRAGPLAKFVWQKDGRYGPGGQTSTSGGHYVRKLPVDPP